MTTEQPIAITKVKPNWDFWGMIDSKGDYILEPICKTIFDWKDGIAPLAQICSVDIARSVSVTSMLYV